MRYDRIRRVLVVVVAGLLFLPAALFSEQNPQPARSVRVSYVIGKVTVKNPGASAPVAATENMPIEAGAELNSGSGGYAAVAFENGSTVQLNGLTNAEFSRLDADGEGHRISLVTLEKGYMDFHLLSGSQDAYQVKVADATMTCNGKSEFQLGFKSGKVSLFVVTGSVGVSAHLQSVSVGKGKSLEYIPSTDSQVAKSHVRVVRLSYLSGTVMIKRPGTDQPEKAVVNTPIQEGFELSSGEGSYAEVEFENGSTARLGELSRLLFNQLALDADGNKLNGMTFEQGYATFHLIPEHNSGGPSKHEENGTIFFQPNSEDAYHVAVADSTVTARNKCEFRTDMDAAHFRVEVFNGSVEIANASQSAQLNAGKVMEHTIGTAELAQDTSKTLNKDAWDQWTEARDRQALLASQDSPMQPYGSSAGWGDLNTYGEWMQFPGGRIGWSPYVGAGWAPFTLGQWGWYPGVGYTWLSGEPWGWVPYHCGLWDFDDTMGWYWLPPMGACGFWQPALVNFYAGPGWIGWSPRGMPVSWPKTRPTRPGPGPGHPSKGLVTVPTEVMQRGDAITPHLVNQITPTGGASIQKPPFEPSPRSGTEAPVSGIEMKGGTLAAGGMPAASAPGGGGAGFGPHHGSAPSAILMGGDPAKEGTLLAHPGHSPLRVADGLTLGGRYAVHGSAGEFRSSGGLGGSKGGSREEPMGGGPVLPSSLGRSGPVFASHGSSGGGGFAGGAGRSGGGGFSGGGHSGGGFSGGGSSAGSSGGHSGGGGSSGGSAAPAVSSGGHH